MLLFFISYILFSRFLYIYIFLFDPVTIKNDQKYFVYIAWQMIFYKNKYISHLKKIKNI